MSVHSLILRCLILGVFAAVGLFADPLAVGASDGATPIRSYRVVNTYPHDVGAFTQGLVFDEGVLYEGTGLYGQSSLRRVDLATGDVLLHHGLASRYFGEGITLFEDRIIQLTWRSNVGFVYDKHSFELLGDFDYPTEGWGITHDGNRLIMSDGTDTLHFLDPNTFEEVDRIDVRDSAGPVTRLNELEYIDGQVYANVWLTDRIARIEPATGQVVDWLDMSGLLDADAARGADVLNGIAYDADSGGLFITGKLWPELFEVKIVPEPPTWSMAMLVLAMAVLFARRARSWGTRLASPDD